MNNNKNNGYLLIISAVILWSLSGLLVKSVTATPLWVSLLRSIGGGVFLLPYVFKEKIFPRKNVILAGIFMSIFLFSITITTRISSSAMAISMQYTAPMYVIGYGFYKAKNVTFNKFIVFILIFIGIIFNALSNLNNILAVITGLIIGISFVFYSYNLQQVKHGNPLGIVALTNIISAFFYGEILVFNYTSPPSAFWEIILLLFSGIVISGISYALYGSGLRQVTIERALIICLAEPILNPIWVYLGNGEVPSMTTVIGVSFILLGAITDILFTSRAKKTEKN